MSRLARVAGTTGDTVISTGPRRLTTHLNAAERTFGYGAEELRRDIPLPETFREAHGRDPVVVRET